MPETVTTKEYDWTYTTAYPGHIVREDEAFEFEPVGLADKMQSIPMNELKRYDPIMYYAEIQLFEDELHDNGSSHLVIRIVRLSSHCQCK